jgi:para-nitrobenzyl esterase
MEKVFVRGLVLAVLVSTGSALFVSCASSPAADAGAVQGYQQTGSWVDNPLVTTKYGQVLGDAAADATWLWKAIPYARPPVGDLRWRAPRQPLPWNGVRHATSFNGGCTQYSPIFTQSMMGSEDCLYLNIWRPKSTEADLPVYVFIHGGGNSAGSSTIVPDYYGNRLAAISRMVFVSLNYRLGPFGWFTHPALRDGVSAQDGSGNYGTLDIIEALRWIQENIQAFGGNPRNVIITGESAGSMNVMTMLISPLARGLFHRAMAESGATFTQSIAMGDERSRLVYQQLLVRDGKGKDINEASLYSSGMSSAQIAVYLRSKSDRVILSLYGPAALGILDNPSLFRDGTVLPWQGFDEMVRGDYLNKVPLILGTNKEEMKLFLAVDGAIPWKSEFYQAVATYGTERWKAIGVDNVARLLTSVPEQPPVYVYQFAWGAPDQSGGSPEPGTWGQRLGAFHTLDIPFFLGNDTVEGVLQWFLFTKENTPGRKALSATMMDYVAQFVRTGNPNRPDSGLPVWSPWSNAPGDSKTIIFDATNTAAVVAMSNKELSLESVLAEVNANLSEPLRSRVLEYLYHATIPAIAAH